MLTKNAKNIVYWTDIHGSLRGDSVRTVYLRSV